MEIINNSRKLTKEIYSIKFPNKEQFGLQSQIRRASISIGLNIAEGNSRKSLKDYLKFCYIAKGSLAEVKECIEISNELNFIENHERDYLFQEHCDIIGKQLSCLINYLKSKIQNPKSK